MFGILFGGLYCLVAIFLIDASEPATVYSGLTFLFWWYCGWGCFCGLLVLMLGGAGGAMTVAGRGEARVAGAGMSFIAFIALVVLTLRTALLMVGVYVIQLAGSPTTPLAEWDTKKVVIGVVVVALTLLILRARTSSSSKD